MTRFRGKFQFAVGDVKELKGDVTILSAVFNKSSTQIEQNLGFEPGRLRDGWCLLYLLDRVSSRDFIWADTTRFSGGFDFDPEIGEFVHRMDSRRGPLLVQFGSDSGADMALDPFLTEQTRRMNNRGGNDLICKVIPNFPHIKDRAWYVQYPNSKLDGIPQWKLLVRKRMRCVATVGPNRVLDVAPIP